MEEEKRELITEWPVISVDHRKKHSSCFGKSSASNCTESVRLSVGDRHFDSVDSDNEPTSPLRPHTEGIQMPESGNTPKILAWKCHELETHSHKNIAQVNSRNKDGPACKYRKKHSTHCNRLHESDTEKFESGLKEQLHPTCTSVKHSTNSSSTENTGGQKELLVQARLARWWRRKGQSLSNFKYKAGVLPNTANPNTVLFHVARLSEGGEFLQEECKQLKMRLKKGERTADLFAALGSIEEWLQHPEDAVKYFTEAVKVEPENKEWQWHLHKALRQLTVHVRQSQLLPMVAGLPAFPTPSEVERVSCKDLSFHDFFLKYSLRRVPVIITDLVPNMTAVPWDLQHIQDVAGNCEVTVKRSVQGSVEWAGLEESKTVRVADFIEKLHDNQDYLFDWSLPLYCPQLAEELTIPKYFAGDFLQRTAPGSLYKDSWPSLFIAPSGISSGLHVDAFASNFWMALLQGRKRWIFFQEDDTPCLYPVYPHSLDPAFQSTVVNPDLVKHPLLSLVHPVECILNAGEILFVPGGSPHYVENLETSLAISANFVDLSNWQRVLCELDVNGLTDPRAAGLAEQFRQPGFVSSMNSGIGDLPWVSFKSWPPQNLDPSEFDICEQHLNCTGQDSGIVDKKE